MTIKMQALRLTASAVSKPTLALTTVPRPVPTSDHVLVKVRATAITPSDVLNANGSFPMTKFPRTPGRDYAGIIEDGPAELIGKEVYGTSGNVLGFSADGCHAEYCLISRNAIAFKPSNLTFAQAATIGVPFTTAALALRRASVQPTDVVLVLGSSGSVGSAACQLAKNQGCKVLTAARRGPADVDLSTDPDLKTAQVDGKGPDVVIDTVGSPTLMHAALNCLAPRGRLSFIAAPRQGSTAFTFDMLPFYRQEKMIVGCNTLLGLQSQTAEDLKGMKEGFENGSLQCEADGNLNKIRIEDAPTAYEKRDRKTVIVFD